MRPPFLDSNIIVYAFEVSGDPRRAEAARLVALGGVISVQTLNECANVFRYKQKRSWSEIEMIFDQLRRWCPPVLSLTSEIQALAMGLAARDGLRIFDANIVATALTADCATLLSEDMQDGRVFDGRLTVRNPFR